MRRFMENVQKTKHVKVVPRARRGPRNPFGLPDGWENLRGPLDPFLDRLFDEWFPRLRSPFALTALFIYVGWLVFDADVPGTFGAGAFAWKLVASLVLSLSLCAMESWFMVHRPRSGRSRWYPAAFAGMYAAGVIIAYIAHH